MAVLSGPMGGTNASGQVTQPMRIAWRGVLCNTGGVVMAYDHESFMPPLRIGHKGLHVERLDGPAYVFNMQHWPDRLIQGTGRTSASAIGVRTGGSETQPTSWTPHPRDQSADMLILMRNRAMIASHGRFLQPDPNATGLPVMGDLSFGGSALSPPRPEVELATWTTDGLNVLAYCSGDAVNRGDPSGLAGQALAMAPVLTAWVHSLGQVAAAGTIGVSLALVAGEAAEELEDLSGPAIVGGVVTVTNSLMALLAEHQGQVLTYGPSGSSGGVGGGGGGGSSPTGPPWDPNRIGQIAEQVHRAATKGVQTVMEVPNKGKRVIDSFIKSSATAQEIKGGYTALSSRTRAEIAKDVALRALGRVKRIEWWFYRSPSGRYGPSKKLFKELVKNNITVIMK